MTGPQLFIDDNIIASTWNVLRTPVTLKREQLSQQPLITATQHHPFQPFFTVHRDPSSGVFRIWYGVPTEDFSTIRSRIAYMESSDGIHWTNAPRILDIGPIQFGVSIIDDATAVTNPDRRYKLGYYLDNGLRIATSSDGLKWNPLTRDAVVRHNHDINGIFYDSLRRRYTAIVSSSETDTSWKGQRRITRQTVSTNLVEWAEPWRILTPDARDEGETQFYAMDGFVMRGDLVIGMVKVLRDDLKADNPPNPPDAYGIGYTTVAWTRDGKTWTRERTPFLDRNKNPGTWDHAHAWIDEQVPVGDEVYLYYAGYKSGHKVNRFQKRQIGLITMKRDRYVAWTASGKGTLRTKPITISSGKLSLNVNAARGQVRVAILTPEGKAIGGFSAVDCKPIAADSVNAGVEWKRDLSELRNRPVVLHFDLRDAELFGFEVK